MQQNLAAFMEEQYRALQGAVSRDATLEATSLNQMIYLKGDKMVNLTVAQIARLQVVIYGRRHPRELDNDDRLGRAA